MKISLKEQQFVDGWLAHNGGISSPTRVRQLAYVLATVHHETAGTFESIRERGGPTYFFKMYDPASPVPERAALARKMGALPGDGIVFYGRGPSQLTWRKNYERFGKRLGIDLVNNPDLALVPENGARILFDGVVSGLFTGRRLSDYINAGKCDYYNARRVINGVVPRVAEDIARKAEDYYKRLTS
jgi:putative chitinase